MKVKMTPILMLLAFLSTSCGHFKQENSKELKYSPVISFKQGDKKFEARVNLPKDFKNKIPLVIIVHEWWGRTPYMMERAQMLNKEGYATLVVDLFGDGKTVETPSEAQALTTPFYQTPQLGIERLTQFVELAKKDPHIDTNNIFIIGYCFGGTQALNFARSGADIKGVVSFHGGLTSNVVAKEIKPYILAINGLADPMVPAKDRMTFEKEMKSLKANHKMINYKGATHAFTNPKATDIGKKYKIPIAYDEKADISSWKELLIFLKK